MVFESTLTQSLVFDIAIIIIIAAIFAYIARLLKQPLILAYIAAGLLAGSVLPDFVKDVPTIDFFSQIGIAFLLFIVGLNLGFSKLKELGKISMITGLGQVVFSTLIGYFIAIYLGFSSITSAYIGLALAFSSTIIVVKLLSDKNDLDSLYGRISIGFLLVQDFIAIISLILLSSQNSNNASVINVIFVNLLKAVILLVWVYLMSRFFLNSIFSKVARNQELLFIASLSWCFFLAIISILLGFSVEIGAFLAGIALANLPYHYEISSKVKPLRDFFLVLFFVAIGIQINVRSLDNIIMPVVIFSLFVLISKPLMMLILMGAFGYTKRTGFLSGLAVDQISEFSLILIVLGNRLGHVSQEVVAIITLVGIITITISTYFINYGDKLYFVFSRFLNIFERKETIEKQFSSHKKQEYMLILIGYGRTGSILMRDLDKYKDKMLIVDYNPDIIKKLAKKGYHVLYGDASDIDFLQELRKLNPKIVISMIRHVDDNLLVLRFFKNEIRSSTIVLKGYNPDEALDLYENGADYVMLPLIAGAELLSRLIKDAVKNRGKILRYKNEHIKHLKSLEF
nr:cation:proton antiporter [Candidatus Woesearchaeota archaeon]